MIAACVFETGRITRDILKLELDRAFQDALAAQDNLFRAVLDDAQSDHFDARPEAGL
jgi:hypothetical protein